MDKCPHPVGERITAVYADAICPICNKTELESLRQENSRLREALKKAHDAMMTWYSSEYAEHPLGKEIYRILHPPKS